LYYYEKYYKKRPFKILNSRDVHYNITIFYVVLHFHVHDSNINQILCFTMSSCLCVSVASFKYHMAYLVFGADTRGILLWRRYHLLRGGILECWKRCLYGSRFSGLAQVSGGLPSFKQINVTRARYSLPVLTNIFNNRGRPEVYVHTTTANTLWTIPARLCQSTKQRWTWRMRLIQKRQCNLITFMMHLTLSAPWGVIFFCRYHIFFFFHPYKQNRLGWFNAFKRQSSSVPRH